MYSIFMQFAKKRFELNFTNQNELFFTKTRLCNRSLAELNEGCDDEVFVKNKHFE